MSDINLMDENENENKKMYKNNIFVGISTLLCLLCILAMLYIYMPCNIKNVYRTMEGGELPIALGIEDVGRNKYKRIREDVENKIYLASTKYVDRLENEMKSFYRKMDNLCYNTSMVEIYDCNVNNDKEEVVLEKGVNYKFYINKGETEYIYIIDEINDVLYKDENMLIKYENNKIILPNGYILNKITKIECNDELALKSGLNEYYTKTDVDNNFIHSNTKEIINEEEICCRKGLGNYFSEINNKVNEILRNKQSYSIELKYKDIEKIYIIKVYDDKIVFSNLTEGKIILDINDQEILFKADSDFPDNTQLCLDKIMYIEKENDLSNYYNKNEADNTFLKKGETSSGAMTEEGVNEKLKDYINMSIFDDLVSKVNNSLDNISNLEEEVLNLSNKNYVLENDENKVVRSNDLSDYAFSNHTHDEFKELENYVNKYNLEILYWREIGLTKGDGSEEYYHPSVSINSDTFPLFKITYIKNNTKKTSIFYKNDDDIFNNGEIEIKILTGCLFPKATDGESIELLKMEVNNTKYLLTNLDVENKYVEIKDVYKDGVLYNKENNWCINENDIIVAKVKGINIKGSCNNLDLSGDYLYNKAEDEDDKIYLNNALTKIKLVVNIENKIVLFEKDGNNLENVEINNSCFIYDDNSIATLKYVNNKEVDLSNYLDKDEINEKYMKKKIDEMISDERKEVSINEDGNCYNEIAILKDRENYSIEYIVKSNNESIKNRIYKIRIENNKIIYNDIPDKILKYNIGLYKFCKDEKYEEYGVNGLYYERIYVENENELDNYYTKQEVDDKISIAAGGEYLPSTNVKGYIKGYEYVDNDVLRAKDIINNFVLDDEENKIIKESELNSRNYKNESEINNLINGKLFINGKDKYALSSHLHDEYINRENISINKEDEKYKVATIGVVDEIVSDRVKFIKDGIYIGSVKEKLLKINIEIEGDDYIDEIYMDEDYIKNNIMEININDDVTLKIEEVINDGVVSTLFNIKDKKEGVVNTKEFYIIIYK